MEEYTANRKNWMGSLSDNFPVKSLLVPGTHDSAAWQSEKDGFGLVLTQKWNFYEQMSNGIRFFDLRLSENLNFFHDKYYLKSSMNDFMTMAKRFLAENPGEGLIIQVKRENCSDDGLFSRNLCNLIKNNLSNFIWGHLPAVLREMRGKIVILCRGNYFTPSVILDYADNDMFERNTGGQTFTVQDCYNVLDFWHSVDDRAARKAYWINKCMDAGNTKSAYWIINFFSHQGLAAANIEALAKKIAQKLSPLRLSSLSHGIMPMDYPNDFPFTDLLINANFNKNNEAVESAGETAVIPLESEIAPPEPVVC
jgi:hypothetical protein